MDVALDLTDNVGSDHTSQPTIPMLESPNDVTSVVPLDNKTCTLNRTVLLHAQRALFDAYLILSSIDSLGTRTMLSRSDRACYGDPIQDPFGTLYTSMMVLRLVKIADKSVCRITGEIDIQLRQQLAAVITVSHKLCSSAHKKDSNVAFASMQALLLPWELPNDLIGWNRLLDEHTNMEMELLDVIPGISIISDTPLYYAELGFQALVQSGRMVGSVGALLRGAAFFFLGACLFNPYSDVLQTMLSTVGPRVVGEALVSVLTACFAAARSPPIRFKLECGKDIDQSASILVRNGRADHAKKLRHGVFESGGRYGYLFERRVLSFVQSMFNQEN